VFDLENKLVAYSGAFGRALGRLLVSGGDICFGKWWDGALMLSFSSGFVCLFHFLVCIGTTRAEFGYVDLDSYHV